jgi:hypothetical protein
VPPSPSSSTGTLIAITVALVNLALFVTAITIRRTLLSYVIAHPRGCVVVIDTLLPATARLRRSCRWLIVMIIRRFAISKMIEIRTSFL